MPELKTLEEYEAAQRDLYSQYVATEPIDIGGARAFNPGDPVPASHVEREIVREDQVKRVGKPSSKPAATTTVKDA